MKTTHTTLSLPRAAGLGALLGFTAALAYGAVYSLYSSARVATAILQTPANNPAFTILANTLSLIVASMFFAIFCGLLAAPIQAAALTLSTALARRWNRAASRRRGAWIGLGCAALFLLALHGLVASAPAAVGRVFWESGYLLWSGLPSLVFLALNGWLGWKQPNPRPLP